MSVCQFFHKRTYSVRPKSNYETLFIFGVPTGIACCYKNSTSKHLLTIDNNNRKFRSKKYLLHCSQNKIAANRRVCRVGRRTYSVRPDGLSATHLPIIKINHSASDFLTLAQLKTKYSVFKNSMGANFGINIGKD